MLFFLLFLIAREEKTALCVEMVKSSHLQQRNTNENIETTAFRMRSVRQTGIKTQIWHRKRCPSTKTTSLNQLFGKCFSHTSKPGHILYVCIHSVFKLFECFYCELGGVPIIKTRSPLLQLSHLTRVYSVSQSAWPGNVCRGPPASQRFSTEWVKARD